jgi:formylglycine-generating enzyme required for sulfatase activity
MDAGVHSAADEICDGLDNDCDGEMDEGCSAPPPVFVSIPAGSFWMGSPVGGAACHEGYTGGGCTGDGNGVMTQELGYVSGETLHYVELTGGFELTEHEVTQGEWEAAFGNNPSYFRECGDACPVERVNWYEALAYANWLSEQTGYPPCYSLSGCSGTIGGGCAPSETSCNSGTYRCDLVEWNEGTGKVQDCTGYRLPTESEWEYAYRAGSVTAFYPSAGNDGAITETGRAALDQNLDQIGWYGGNSTATYDGAFDCPAWFTGSTACGPQPGGAKESNAWGLYDMAGNVFEWCWDWETVYPSGTLTSPAQDPVGPGTGLERVLRGGAWVSYALHARAACRNDFEPVVRHHAFGHRLARSL